MVLDYDERQRRLAKKCPGGCELCDETQGPHYWCEKEIARLEVLVRAYERVIERANMIAQAPQGKRWGERRGARYAALDILAARKDPLNREEVP